MKAPEELRERLAKTISPHATMNPFGMLKKADAALSTIEAHYGFDCWSILDGIKTGRIKTGRLVAVPKDREVAWLVERPRTPDAWEQWWHPEHGWTRDSLRALRFSREEDATAYIQHGGRFPAGVKAMEHIWLVAAPKPGDAP